MINEEYRGARQWSRDKQAVFTVVWISFLVAAIGTMHYEDYREIDGVLVSFRQTITLGTPRSASALESDFVHRVVVDSVRFDSVDPAALRPLEGLPAPGDRKPV